MKTILALLTSLLCAVCACAQSDTGMPADEATIAISPYEAVAIGTLNIVVQAPVRSKGGPLPLSFMLTANGQVYVENNLVNGSYTHLYRTTASSPSGFFASGVHLAQGYWFGQLAYTTQQTQCNANGQLVNATQYIVSAIYDGNGTSHPITGSWFSNSLCNSGTIDHFSTDHSGYEMLVDVHGGLTIYGRDGINPRFAFVSGVQLTSGSIVDTHGNTVNVAVGGSPNYTTTYTDPLTSTPVLTFNASPPVGTPISYAYTDGTGAQQSVTASFLGGTSGTTFQPAYQCSGITNGSGPIYPVSSIAFPDSSSLSFTWNTTTAGNLDGRLKTVTIPTGATFTHSYSGGTFGDGLYCDQAPFNVSNATLTITNGTGTWTFVRTIGGGTYPNRTITTTVTNPDGSKRVYTFIGDNNPILTSKVTKDTDGTTVLDTWDFCYDSTISNCNSATFQAIDYTWRRAYHYVPGVTNPAEIDTEFDTTYGNVLEVDRYDFGPTLINKTLITYGSWNGSSCVSLAGIHITNKPCDTQTQDATGGVMEHSRFAYNTSTGDLLNTYAYSSATANLSTTMTYNSNGTLATSSSVDGVSTTFGNSQCNGFLPDHATTSVGTVSMTWDCNGAVPLSTTDLNSLTTFYAYNDPLYRVTDISDNGGQTDLGFTYSSPTRSSVGMSFNSGNSIVSETTTLNSLGQVISKQHPTAPGSTNYDTVSYTYDTTMHLKTESQACTTTLGATCSATAVTYTYDGANRPLTVKTNTPTNGVLTYSYPTGDVKIVLSPAPTGENTKTIQIEKDGLGRTLRVCAVTGMAGSGACGERTAASGYLTLYTLDALGRAIQISRNAQATPVNSNFAFDFLSRPTIAILPESQTSNFYYDTANGCAGSRSGHLTKTTDADGNAVCYQYDSMGRLSNIQYSGGNASVTPQKYFYYDSGGLGSNLVGKLSSSVTCFSPCSSYQTVYNFGYDKYGRKTDVWQNTPLIGAGNWYHTTASFWDNGALKTLSGVPGLATFNYGLDGEGRPYTTTSGSGTYVSSVAYDSASRPTGIDYGNGDSDAYAWDAVTGNMTQYLFTVGAGQNSFDYGALTWNPNGTLQTLAITDHFSTSDTQTCNTAHDDLVRITAYNCGAIFNETYAYSPDYAGNVTKSGTISFNPGYTASNNRYASGSGYTYDANGNILHDATLNNTYTYDSDNNIHSVSGTNLIYDAFDRNVEPNSITDVLYSPVGRIGWVAGLTSPVFINMPLSGGSSVTFGSSVTAQLEHYDFMGSVRLTSGFASRGVNQIFAYGPSGEPYIQTPNSNQVVEGAWQDTAIGMFDFGGAHDVPNTSRWTSPAGGANGYVKDNSPF